MSDNSTQESAIRTILKSEVTQIVATLIALFTFVRMVILPLQEIQIKLAQVQLDLADIKNQQKDVTINSKSISILQQEVQNIKDQLNK